MTDSPMRYVVQGRNDKGRWATSRYARPMTLEEAKTLAADLDEHGNDARVVEWKR